MKTEPPAGNVATHHTADDESIDMGKDRYRRGLYDARQNFLRVIGRCGAIAPEAAEKYPRFRW